MELTCADVYVRIFFRADCGEFILTKGRDNTVIPMRAVLRDDNSIVYHGITSFIVSDEQMSFAVDFARHSTTTFFLSSAMRGSDVTDAYPQFAPREGAVTLTDDSLLIFQDPPTNAQAKRWLPTMTAEHIISGAGGVRGVWVRIEIHCYERCDDV